MTSSLGFRSIRPETIVSPQGEQDLVQAGSLGRQPIPLVLAPERSRSELGRWADQNRDRIPALLAEHGALLFRGFEVDSATGFRRFAAESGGDPLEYTSAHPARQGGAWDLHVDHVPGATVH